MTAEKGFGSKIFGLFVETEPGKGQGNPDTDGAGDESAARGTERSAADEIAALVRSFLK